MMARSTAGSRSSEEAAAKGARWLHAPDGDAPVLLIAPHGGHAGPATRAMLNPKVNDLHTADITRELAQRLGASAIINAGMDRNRLDLNRLSQVMSDAPWMLELIAARLERMVERSGRAVVLLIHGWNVIEPRVDVGIGVKSAGATLLPACGAHVSVSDGFVNGPLLDFVASLRQSGIEPTFGLRYPGAGANNLLQAFTRRHASSPVDALRRLAALNARGALEAVQLELSVTLRMPGRFRTETIAAIAESFARYDRRAAALRPRHIARARRIEITRTIEPPSATPRRGARQSTGGPMRVGLEFYDPSTQVGAMASFDLGAGAAGARVMAVAGRERIALFTAEGRVERTAQGLTLGPLALRVEGGRLRFDFTGPAVVVDDGSAYLSVERALAKAALHEAMEVHAEFEPWPVAGAPAQPHFETLVERITGQARAAEGVIGKVGGYCSLAGIKHRLSAVARVGRAFIGIGDGAFRARRMIWAAFPNGGLPRAIEARTLVDGDGAESARASILDREGWAGASLEQLQLTPTNPKRPPRRISATLQPPGERGALTVDGQVQSFVMLSRPGPAQTRILTALGFAAFRIGEHRGAGMFECSQRSAPPAPPRARAEATEAADNDES